MKKKTEQEVEQEVRQRLLEIDQLKEEARQLGLSFSALDKEQLVKKIKGITSNSPYIFAQVWISGTTPGSSAYYRVYIANPDPVSYYPVFASICFGAGINFMPAQQIGSSLKEGNFNVDQGWPYRSSQPFSLAAGATTNITFNYLTPVGAPLATYIGNCIVWRGDYHDQGAYLDRGLFHVTLS